MPRLPLDLDALVVSTFETTPAAASEAQGDAQVIDKTFLCRPSQNWSCTV